MAKHKFTSNISQESRYEWERLASMWDLSGAQALEKCIHIAGALCRKSSDRSVTQMAKERKAEAALELAKSERTSSR